MNKKYEKYKSFDPNKKNVFINWDAIDSLPEGLEASFSELIFDPKKLDEFFSNVGSESNPSWYPKTDTMYKIADMCGISGEPDKTVEWIQEEVDINIILMKPFGAEPTMRKIKTEARVTKRSSILCEDNTRRLSPPETNLFNFFVRASIEFLDEEEKTNNYTKKTKYYKYDTVIKRRRRLLELEKFAAQQAETKAFCKTVRVLAGLPTGFKTKDLQEGKLVFCKYIKSKRLQKLETAARIESIRNGNTRQIQDTSNDLFGQQQIEPPIDDLPEDIEPEPEPEKKTEKKENPFKVDLADYRTGTLPGLSEKEKLKVLIEQYYNENIKVIEDTPGAKDFIIKTTVDNFDEVTEDNLKTLIKKIESISDIKIIDHGINLDELDIF